MIEPSREEILAALRDAIRADPTVATAAIALAIAEIEALRSATRDQLDTTIEAFTLAHAELAELRARLAAPAPWWRFWARRKRTSAE